MKRILAFTCATMMAIGVDAQTQTKAFSHLDAAVTVGTTGVGIDLQAPLSNSVAVRTGFTYMPKVNVDVDFHLTSNNAEDATMKQSTFNKASELFESLLGYKIDETVTAECEPTFANWKLLVDFMPFRNKNWHLTAGFYLGGKTVGKARNKQEEAPALVGVGMYNNILTKYENFDPIYENTYLDPDLGDKMVERGRMGFYMGDRVNEDGTTERYLLEPDENAMVTVDMKVNAFRPYLGFGYGGALSKKNDRARISFDAGAMFWGGTPRVITNDGTDLTHDIVNVRGKVGDYVRAVKGLKVYPVLDLRLSYRIF